MKNLLVTGAAGFLGWHVCRAAAQGAWRVTGVLHERAFEADYLRLVKADLTDYQQQRALMDACSPDAVIHTAAISRTDLCQKNPETCRRINIDAAVNCAGLCAERKAAFVFTSSDQVFDGRQGPYAEDAPLNPINAYGAMKAEAEQEIRRVCPAAIICRMPLLFGDASPGSDSVLQRTIAALRDGRTQTLFTDEFRTPASALSATDGLLIALNRGHGIVHLGGVQRLSRYEFGLLMAQWANVNTKLIHPARQADSPMARYRPADVSLDSSLAHKLGYNPRPVKEEFARLRKIP